MYKKKVRWVFVTLCGLIIYQVVSPAVMAREPHSIQEARAIEEVYALVPTSKTMVDEAIEVLSEGWAEMSPQQKKQFQLIFDPSQTGDIDDAFIQTTLDNYRKIRRRLEGGFSVRFEADSDTCNLMRLYYTDLVKLHVCPYFMVEESSNRKARVLIHEVAHMALWVSDRPYYDPKSYSTRYNALTPRGSWAAQIPLVGFVFREISRSDTLFHPDTYSWFAEWAYTGD